MRYILWSSVLACLLTILRLLVLGLNSSLLNAPYTAGIIFGFAGQFCLALPLAILVFSKNNRPVLVLGWATVSVFILFNIASFHYESVFGRLPSAAIFYYLGELPHLKSSLAANAPLLIIALEFICIITTQLLFHARLNRRIAGKLDHPKWTFAIFFAGVIVTSIVHVFPAVIPDAMLWGSRNALVWYIKSSFTKADMAVGNYKIERQNIWELQYKMGHKFPFGGEDPSYPLCSPSSMRYQKGNERSIILIILESVGNHEMLRLINGQELMPNLKRIARSNLFFSNTLAPGTISSQALPAIFSGLPPQTYMNILWQKPFLNMKGFPNTLASAGYETAFFHGADLSFEHQREFLASVGFKKIFEYNPNNSPKAYGWGYDDRNMFAALRKWIAQNRKKKPFSPYLASLSTLSTHDPYVLPEDWEPVFFATKPKNLEDASLEAYYFLDHYLGEFYKWFQKEEASKGTILVITADHAQNLPFVKHQIQRRHKIFRVPLIIAGLSPEEIDKYRKYQKRLASTYDVPATLMPLLGMHSHSCDQGINLLSPPSLWSDDRIVYSVAGEDLIGMYFWEKRGQVVYDRERDKFEVISSDITANIEVEKTKNLLKKITNFSGIILPVSKYLIDNNAYFPVSNDLENPAAELPRVAEPIFVSHRGNVNGPGDSQIENSAAAIEQALAAGFEWVEIDVQITSDRIPILMHDKMISIGNSRREISTVKYNDLKKNPAYASVMSLNEAVDKYSHKINLLIEAKRQKLIYSKLALSGSIAKIVKERRGRQKIIVDSFDSTLISSVTMQCQCETAFDTPYKEKVTDDWLHFVKRIGVKWIYVHHSSINTNLVVQAHKYGLKVMAYTVNDYNIISSWGDELPDGIITDHVEIKNMWAARRDTTSHLKNVDHVQGQGAS